MYAHLAGSAGNEQPDLGTKTLKRIHQTLASNYVGFRLDELKYQILYVDMMINFSAYDFI